MYHKDGVATHAFRFATQKDVDKPENHKGAFWRSPLVSWGMFPSTELRDKLTGHDWGKASLAISDKNFAGNIGRALPLHPEVKVPRFKFDPNSDS